MIIVGILGLATVIAVCAWVVVRDPEAMNGRAVQERARAFQELASSVRSDRTDDHSDDEVPRRG